MAGGKEDWRRVRVLRAKPPGLAEQDDERRHMFQAALSQSEELWEAAAVIGPASRPLPLFYCVSQAGRAVCAAWSLAEEWRPSVAELWASLPGFPTVDPNVAGHPPYPIRLERAQARKLALTKPENLEGESLLKLIATPTRAVIRSRHPGPPEELPETYPTMSGIEQDGTQPDPLGDEEPVFKFVGEDGNPRLLSRVGSRPHDDPRSFTKFVVRPKVGEAAIGPPSEFLVSWALLFCLSELARYYPDAWVLTLNPDTSTVAVTIEAGLDFALDRAPALISQALRGPVPVLRNE